MKDRMNWMLDGETLAVCPNAVLRNLALAPFTLSTAETKESLRAKTLSIWISGEDQLKHGREIDEDTWNWWNKNYARAHQGHPDEIYAAHILGDHPDDMSVEDACQTIAAYMNDIKADGLIFSRGSNFDFPILESLFKNAKMEIPWNTWKVTCSKSIIRFICEDDRDTEMGLVSAKSSHEASYDVAIEVLKLQKIYEILSE